MTLQPPRTFNSWLRGQLKEKKMSQRQLALQSGVDHSTISRLIKGDRMPSLGTATKLARGSSRDRRAAVTTPPLSDYAQRKKIDYFLRPIPRSAAILEVGSGSGWVGKFLRENGWTNYRGIDFAPPADTVGDIRRWKELGLAPESFDVIVAFEVVEHVACLDACFELLKPGGSLLLTSPVPRMDWACRMLEAVGLNQKRTSPHDNLIDFRNVPRFRPVEIRVIAGMFQWGKFMRPGL